MSNRLSVAEAEELARCIEHGLEPMVRANLNTWTASLLDGGAAEATARSWRVATRGPASGPAAAR